MQSRAECADFFQHDQRVRATAANGRKLETCWCGAEENIAAFRCCGPEQFRTAINGKNLWRMRRSTLKHESLIFERKTLGSRGDDSGVFEMNQDPVSSEQDD